MTTSPVIKPNVNVAGVLKVERVGPVFRIVDPYCKKIVKPVPIKRTAEEDERSADAKRKRGDLYADDNGPFWHKMSNPMITPPIIVKNLPLQFKDLPIFGAPDCPADLDKYERKRIREFVGCDLDDAELEELENYCNPDNLKTGKEIKMTTRVPVPGLISKAFVKDVYSDDENNNEKDLENELCILKKLRMRQARDVNNVYPRCLKYRGVKQLPLREQEDNDHSKKLQPPDLEPGKDTLYRIRVYRPFTFHLTGEKHVRGRHSVFNCDSVMLGRQPLTTLRDRFSCRNDLDMRLDKSANPDDPPTASARTMFPSGFLFINNVFYVDTRTGCRDMSAVIRRWAADRGMGEFQVRDMSAYNLDDVLVKLAHPEVYMHQGSCEHVFLFSEIRLLNRSDPLHLSSYPCHTAISQNQTIYCTTCAEFGAKWLVTDSLRVPFNPGFFCEVCFKEYLYRKDAKIGEFQAYPYRGNEINLKSKTVIAYL